MRLVRERGRLMKAAGERNPGGIGAVLGLDEPTVTDICRQAGGAQVANDNAPGQIVISGTLDGIEKAMDLARQAGARRVIRLAVSIAAHSALMTPIVDEFAEAVKMTPIKMPTVPVISNITARPLESVPAIQEELVQQLTSPVRWVDSVRYMVEQGVTTFVEIGSGDVLAGLIRRIDRNVKRVNVGVPADIINIQTEQQLPRQGGTTGAG
ncbi:MAG: ACP S-malonyltransferase [Chloroflexi bacterium]|nr:MAG: ACP S-malonyltransferase [Chloroflexota bacterium]